MKKVCTVAIAAGIAVGLAGCATQQPAVPTPTVTISSSPTPTPSPTPHFTASNKPESLWFVVNKQRPMNPVDFEPQDMAVPTALINEYGRPLRTIAARALDSLAASASAEGITLSLSSAYRGYDAQAEIYYGYAAALGEPAADLHAARPGYSEHQTGFSVDLDDGSGCPAKACFADTAAGQWLAARAWEFGFIQRYPAGTEAITGYEYEPWHYRYVGKEVATAMHNSGIATLEEFFGLPAAPGY